MKTIVTSAPTVQHTPILQGIKEAQSAVGSQPPEDRWALLLDDPDALAIAQGVGTPAVRASASPKGLSGPDLQGVRGLECEILIVYTHTREGYAWGLASAHELSENGVGVGLVQWPSKSELGYGLPQLWDELGKDPEALKRALERVHGITASQLPFRPRGGFFHPKLEDGRPFLFPQGYVLGRDATYKVEANTKERWLEPVASRPLWIDQLMEDLDSQTYAVRICTTQARPLRVQRGVLMDSQRLKALADYGFPVRSVGAGKISRYLEEAENINREGLPALRTISRMGWRGKDGFSWGTTIISKDGDAKVSPTPSAGIEDMWFDRHHAAGTPEKWASVLGDLTNHHVPTVLLLASLASPLNARFGVQSGVFETVGETSSGKTSAQTIAQSVWGYGHEDVLPTWNTTIVGLEVMLATHHHLPLILNENRSSDNGHRHVGDQAGMAYMIYEGTGRVRANKSLGLSELLKWNLNVLASGEHSMTSATASSGIVARVFPLWSPPFRERSTEAAALVKRLVSVVNENYGHAGPMMMRRLMELDADEWDTLRNLHQQAQDILTEKAKGKPQEKYAPRIALSWGVLWVAASVLERLFPGAAPKGAYHKAILKGWDELMSKGNERSYSERALDVARELLASRYAEFAVGSSVPEDVIGKVVSGYRGGDFVGFFKAPLQKALKEAGMNLETAKGHWENEGILLTTGRGDKVVKINGGTVRCVAIKSEALELMDSNDEEVEPDTLLDACPF